MEISDKKIILAIILVIVLQFSLIAQKAPIKYGEVSKAELEMKVYPSDTSATAAVLCDYGYFDSDKFQFVRIQRIKIFKKEGTSWGNQIFPVYSKANIKGITYNLENGEIVQSKLKPESIFRERVTEYYFRTRVAMPNVKEGSIIDIEFNILGFPGEWWFQEEIPVRWSELIIEPSSRMTYRKNFFGFVPLSENTDSRWIAKDMPAFKNEPFMNSPKNYLTKFEFELINLYNNFYQGYNTAWEQINLNFHESYYFGKALEGNSFLNSIAKNIEKNYTNPFERLKASQEAIKKAVKWNERESVYSE